MLNQLRQALADLHQIRLLLEAFWIDTQILDGTPPTHAETASRDSYFNTTATPKPDQMAETIRKHEAEMRRY